MNCAPSIDAFFDEPTNSVSYLVSDPASGAAAVIDAVLDFDPGSGDVSTGAADAILAKVAEHGLTINWLLETHAHADHLSAANHLRSRTGAKLAIGSGIREVQRVFGSLLQADDVRPDGADFNLLLNDGDRLPLGELEIEVMATPGHTPACVSYKIGDAVFVGDTLVHARLWDCPMRLSRWVRASAVPFDPAHPVAAAGDAAVPVPRL